MTLVLQIVSWLTNSLAVSPPFLFVVGKSTIWHFSWGLIASLHFCLFLAMLILMRQSYRSLLLYHHLFLISLVENDHSLENPSSSESMQYHLANNGGHTTLDNSFLILLWCFYAKFFRSLVICGCCSIILQTLQIVAWSLQWILDRSMLNFIQ